LAISSTEKKELFSIEKKYGARLSVTLLLFVAYCSMCNASLPRIILVGFFQGICGSKEGETRVADTHLR